MLRQRGPRRMDALTREPTIQATRPRARRWVMPLASLVLIAAVGAALWFWPVAGNNAAKDRFVNEPYSRGGRDRRTARRADLPRRARHRAGLLHRHHPADGRRPAGGGGLQGGPGRRKGDVLARIDARTYQAALDQARRRRRRTRRCSPTPASTWRATRSWSAPPIPPRSRPTRRSRWSRSSRRRSARIRRRSTPPARSSATARSPRRSTGGPASARSIRATSCTRRTPPAPRTSSC